MDSYSNPFTKALLKNDEIKRDVIRKQVHLDCLEANLITQMDINTNSEQQIWVDDIIDDHLVCSSLLKQLKRNDSEPNKKCELFESIVHDIVENLMSHRKTFPRRKLLKK
jgi:hypothetical protein